MEKTQIDRMIEKIKISVDSLTPLQADLTNLANELDNKQRLLEERENKLVESQNINAELQESYLSVQEELKKVSTLYTELTGKQEANVNIKQILSVYVTLLEKIFEGKVHAKLLFTLHGETDHITRQELNQSLGFSAAAVLHAIHELRAGGLIDYNEETEIITLKDKIY